jgi:O-antigen/teichoic acid export membrane protein
MVSAFGGNVVTLAAVTAAAMINMRICYGLMGKADYGLFMLVGTVAGWTALGDLGFGSAVRQRMTALLARREVDEAARVLSSGIAFYLTMAVVMFAAFLVLHVTGATTVVVKETQSLDMARVMRLLFLGVSLVLVTFPLVPVNGLLLARNDFLAQNVFTIFSSLSRPVISWFVLKTYMSVEIFLISMTAWTLVDLALRYAYVLYRVPGLLAKPALASYDMVKSLVTPSIMFFVISVGYVVIYSTDNVVISKMIGLAAIPAYSAAFRLFSTLRSLCVTSGDVLFPAAGILDSQGEHERLQKYIEITARVSMTLAVLGGIGLTLLGAPLISRWMGSDIWNGPGLGHAYGTLVTLGFLLPIATIVNMTTRSVCGVGRHHKQAVICVVEMVSNLALSIAFAPFLGVMGVALGTLIARAAVTPWYFMDGVRQLRLDGKRLLSVAVIPNVILAAVLFAAVWFVKPPEQPSWWVISWWIAGYGAFCCVVVVALMPRDVRQRGMQWLSRKARPAAVPVDRERAVETVAAREE